MTTGPHASAETIADYCADLLPAADADRIAAHLSHCRECEELASAIGQVSEILSGAAENPGPMPESVQQQVEATLRRESSVRAQEATAGSVVGLVGRRKQQNQPSGPARPRWPLMAAAAVLGIVGGGAVVLELTGSGAGDPTASSAHDSLSSPADGAADPPADDAVGEADSPPSFDSRRLSPRNLRAYADRLTRSQAGVTSARPPELASGGACATPTARTSEVVTVGRWDGARAVIAVDPTARRVTVLDCRTASTVLYSTGY